MNVKLGLIGGGYWGKNLIREFHKVGVLRTICEIDVEAIKKYQELYPDVGVTADWSEVLADQEITAVCVSLPADMHYRFAREALLADKDVYVEKPITLSLSEAEELIKLADEHKRMLMVGHLLHYHSAVIRMKELIADGRIGRVKNIVSNRLNLGKFRTAENVLWSFAPHDISVILSLCGGRLPETVICTGKANLTKGIPDITNTVMTFGDDLDIYANINVNWLNPYKEQRLVVIGEHGMIVFDDVKKEDKLLLYSDYLQWSSTLPAHPEATKNAPEVIDIHTGETTMSPLERECRSFVTACQSRQPAITDGQEGLRVLQVLQAAQRSLEQGGQPVNLQEFLAKETTETTESPDYFCHPSAFVDKGAKIGAGTKIWHGVHVCSIAEIGKNCSLGHNVYIAGKLGDGSRVQNNVSVYQGVVCEEFCFLGPSCVFTNDKNPRVEHSKRGEYLSTYLERGVSIGANATIVCGTRLGTYCLIGAGAVVTKDVPAYAIMVGNPAKQIGTIDEYGNRTLW